MFGRKYQWVIMGTYAEEWWLRPGSGCAPSELSEALHGTILTDLLPLSTEQQITVSGIVSNITVTDSNVNSHLPRACDTWKSKKFMCSVEEIKANIDGLLLVLIMKKILRYIFYD